MLRTLVKKVERIHDGTGSLSAVVMDRLSQALETGIDARACERIEAATAMGEQGGNGEA